MGLSDIMRLRLVNRDLHAIVRGNCRLCTHLRRIASTDIRIISDKNTFPNLKSFSLLTVSHRMSTLDVGALMQRWHKWEACSIATKNHSRRALKMVMLKVDKMRHLQLSIDPRINRRYLLSLESAMYCCIRRNYQTLQRVDIQCDVLVDAMIRPLSQTNLCTLKVWSRYISNTNLQRLCTCIPPNLKSLLVSTACPCTDSLPRFLALLSAHDSLQTLLLENCISDYALFCDPLGLIADFCQNTRLQHFETNMLRMDHVETLVASGVARVDADIIGVSGRIADTWRSRIPSSYNLRLV